MEKCSRAFPAHALRRVLEQYAFVRELVPDGIGTGEIPVLLGDSALVDQGLDTGIVIVVLRDAARIQALVDERTTAKQSRDFARADAIRKQLADEGVLIEDTAQGVRWKRA